MERCQPFATGDIDPFLALAQGEGWLCDRWEFDFLLRSFPQGCYAYREGDDTLGYVTSVSYGRSGWIGNLMVRPELRKRGIGRELMQRAVSALLAAGVKTVWLTASEQGAGLYRKLGFAPIDSIQRWSGKGTINLDSRAANLEIESLRAMDRVGWGDWREALLNATCGRGRLYASSGGFLCCQQWHFGVQIGPWGSLIGNQAGQLLDQALTAGDETVFLDVPAGNFAAGTLLAKRGFTVTGSNLLMYLGDDPPYRPGNIYALASMGSIG